MDIRIPLICVLAIGGAIGLVMPTGEEGGSVAERLAAAPAGGTDPSATNLAVVENAPEPTAQGWGGEFTLDRRGDGHFYADVVIDGTSTNMLVDTGASVIALTGQDAASLGLSWDSSQVRPVAQGASGAVHGVHTVLPRVSLGQFEARNVAAIIVPEGLGISLLGQSFLSQVKSVQIADDRMVLSD